MKKFTKIVVSKILRKMPAMFNILGKNPPQFEEHIIVYHDNIFRVRFLRHQHIS